MAWHAVKRLAMDMEEVHMPGTNTKKYKRNFIKEASNWDYLISPNGYSSEIFARAFQFNKTMIESGYPRNDFLHNDNNEETILLIKRRLNIPIDKRSFYMLLHGEMINSMQKGVISSISI